MNENIIERLTPKQDELVNKLLEKILKETKRKVEAKYIFRDKEDDLSILICEKDESSYYVGYCYEGNINYIQIDNHTAQILIEDKENS